MTDSTALPDTQDGLNAALMEQALSKNLDIDHFRALLAAGADPNIRHENTQPLLHRLTMKGHVEAIEAALDAGADLHAVDGNGNGVLANSFLEDVLLTLMLRGASPSVTNHGGRTAAEELPNYMGRHGFNALIEKSSNLLKNCQFIEQAAQRGTISETTWDNLWPGNAFGYPGGFGSRVPEFTSLVYMLHKMEEAGKTLPKSLLDGMDNCNEALRRSVGATEMTATMWRDHCEKAGTPMTAKDWNEVGLGRLYEDGKVACLFTPDYWADKPSLDGMVELFATLPDRVKQDLPERLENTIAHTMHAWAKDGAGKKLDSEGLKEFRNSLPDNMQPLFRNFHALLTTRQRAEHGTVRGR